MAKAEAQAHTIHFDFRGKLKLAGRYLLEPARERELLLLAHGANGGIEHPLLMAVQEALAVRNISVLNFQFPYVAAGKRTPNSDPVLQEAWVTVLGEMARIFSWKRLFIGGKSLGGRIASQMLARSLHPVTVQGLLFLGFPLHAPGRCGQERADHLQKLSLPQLFVQGSRDPLAAADLIREVVAEQQSGELFMVEGGDHSFRVPGRESTDVLRDITDKIGSWISEKQR